MRCCLIARYREELSRFEDTHEAMRAALHASVPAIVASAATVASALFVLLLADNNGTQSLGPIAAIGVLFAMLSMLSLLPALMLIFGRFAFWPFVPRFDESAGRTPRAASGQARRARPFAPASNMAARSRFPGLPLTRLDGVLRGT